MNMLINGLPNQTISAMDRGFSYGDGVFRTLTVSAGFVPFWEQHIAHLANDAARLGIPCPDITIWAEDVANLWQTVGNLGQAVLKLTLTRGVGARGYLAAANPEVTRMVQITPWQPADPQVLAAGVKTALSDVKLGWQPLLAGVKHLNRLENVLAKTRLASVSVYEGLMLDQSDCLIEGIQTNLLLQATDGCWLTPDLSQCGVAGLTRALVIARLQENNERVEVTQIGLPQLQQAKHVWLMNSLTGLVPVASTQVGSDCWDFAVRPFPYALPTDMGWRIHS